MRLLRHKSRGRISDLVSSWEGYKEGISHFSCNISDEATEDVPVLLDVIMSNVSIISELVSQVLNVAWPNILCWGEVWRENGNTLRSLCDDRGGNLLANMQFLLQLACVCRVLLLLCPFFRDAGSLALGRLVEIKNGVCKPLMLCLQSTKKLGRLFGWWTRFHARMTFNRCMGVSLVVLCGFLYLRRNTNLATLRGPSRLQPCAIPPGCEGEMQSSFELCTKTFP